MEAPPLVVLDRIGSRGGEASTTTSTTVRRTFRCANLQGYEDLIYFLSLFASPRLDLGFPVRIRRIFLIYYAAKPFSGIRARSMCRCVSRGISNMLVAGVDVFCCNPLVVYLLWRGIVRSKRSRSTLRDLVRETGSALDVLLVPLMRLVDDSLSHYSCHGIYTGCWQP